MGRIFEKRKYKMFARFDRMAKTFTRIGKEISIAVKLGGPNPDANPRLRAAIQNAKTHAMPKDRVEAAIKRACGKDAENLQEVVYEGYAPHGVALVIEAATDNPNRTVANIRSYFNKFGGSLATAGALEFMFQRKGVFKINPAGKPLDELELDLIDAGAEDVDVDDDEGVIIAYTDFEGFAKMQKTLEDKGIDVQSAELQRIPNTTITLSEEQMDDVAKLIERIEEDEDVQNVFHNIA
ncbi:MAG: YebC/PmpR family DNA-binding transcriptional regulator [Bacteroidota bacterium]|nr:YebC/PmpR family DNA-binding transcriptional regulator [Candidatus Kapabacteria bacterium]MDW8219113.1 YebC/PmpR family DNA-binding transcriptional regulator [Bacteroidota bacterium]